MNHAEGQALVFTQKGGTISFEETQLSSSTKESMCNKSVSSFRGEDKRVGLQAAGGIFMEEMGLEWNLLINI